MTDGHIDEERWSRWFVQAQQGDEAAYALLLGELAPAIRAYLISRFGWSDLLDDCVQDCLLSIHNARHTFDPSRPLRPWLFTIVRHRMIDLLRQKHGHVIDAGEIGHQPDLARLYDGAMLLGKLSENLREALLLTKFAGLSTRECASRLGVSESVVKVRVYRGIRKLRAIWEAEA